MNLNPKNEIKISYTGIIKTKTDIVIEMCKSFTKEELSENERKELYSNMSNILENVIERYMEYRWNILNRKSG